MASARSLDAVARDIANALRGDTVDTNDTRLTVGRFLAAVVLQALAAEIAIKSLQVLRKGNFCRGHDLFVLFSHLPACWRAEIGVLYHGFIRAIAPAFYGGLNHDLEAVLQNHSRDFVEWRYLGEVAEGTHVNLVDLRIATRALIQHYDTTLNEQRG